MLSNHVQLAAILAAILTLAFSQGVLPLSTLLTLLPPQPAAEAASAVSSPRLNPEIGGNVESFGSFDERNEDRGFRTLKNTVGLVQHVELGGRRSDLLSFAAYSGETACEAVTALAAVKTACHLVGVERERARLATQTLRAARAQVEACHDPLLQVEQVEVVRTTDEIVAGHAQWVIEIALAELAVFIRVPCVDLASVSSSSRRLG